MWRRHTSRDDKALVIKVKENEHEAAVLRTNQIRLVHLHVFERHHGRAVCRVELRLHLAHFDASENMRRGIVFNE
jgi:hypothetical protein